MAFTLTVSLPILVGVLLLFLDLFFATLMPSTSFTPIFVLTAIFIEVMHCATTGVEVDFSTLMFTAMTQFGNDLQEGDLPFAGAISALIERLGICLHTRFATGGDTLDIRPQHVLRCIGWSGCPPLNCSGGEAMDADELAADTERRLHIWSGVDNASNYASSPEWMI
ncbi:hypothetical protein LINPERHAP2_LOCUS38577 [Linum perenne]